LTNPTALQSLKGHITELDGFRGIAILIVMIFHFTDVRFMPITALDRAIISVCQSLWIGVDMFFVLSGFLITGILLDSRGKPKSLRNFYVRRVLRIFPLYYLLVILCLVVLPMFPHPKAQNFGRIAGYEPLYWLFMSNISVALSGEWRHAALDITWSLAIEEQFYIIWPFIVLFSPIVWIKRVCYVLIPGAFVIRALMLAAGVDYDAVYVLAPTRMDPLLIGAFLALWLREDPTRIVRHNSKAILTFLLSATAAAVFLASKTWSREPRLVTYFFGLSFIGVAFGATLLVILGLHPDGIVRRILRWKALLTLGTLSYCIYLCHVPVRGIIRDVFIKLPGQDIFAVPVFMGSQMPVLIVFGLASGIVSVGIAWVSWHSFEKQFIKLKRFFPSGSATHVAESNARPQHDQAKGNA